MSEPIINPFERDDPAGWPVCATIVIHVDPRAADEPGRHGFVAAIKGELPPAIVSSILLRQVANMITKPDFQRGMGWLVGADDDEGEEGERRG